MMMPCSQEVSWGKLFQDLLKQGFLTRGAGLMNEKSDICERDDLFFGLHLIFSGKLYCTFADVMTFLFYGLLLKR